uniref:Uncharacterized protein n=1 Tax=Rhizophagus irregularis (strain DAOM 181602 / DAOM 197198 / MUCL 43194) TaxID=747089 RepID=U9TP83_RHIID
MASVKWVSVKWTLAKSSDTIIYNHDYLFCHILQIIIFGIEVGTDIRPSDLNQNSNKMKNRI